ncbi:MAG: isoprenylcysteine carboxylmethyltransferase family protein [Pseudomonadota bacterium]
MPLREEFESNGTWLFRWRSYLPLLLVALFLLALRDYHYIGDSEELDDLWELVCLVTSFLGLGIRAFTVGYAPRGTSGRNTRKQIADTLNTTGLYSVVRNPLYLGNFFMGLGPAMFAGLWWLVLIYMLAFALYYERIIFAEEAFLRERFGEVWIQWAERTPAFFPRFRQYVRPQLSFSWRTVLRREYNGLFGVVSALFVLEVVGDLAYLGHFELDGDWLWLISASFMLWVVLRVLKKYTHVLDVDGR